MAKEEVLSFPALCCFKTVTFKCICLCWRSCLSANGRESTAHGLAVNICKMASLASCVSILRRLLCSWFTKTHSCPAKHRGKWKCKRGSRVVTWPLRGIFFLRGCPRSKGAWPVVVPVWFVLLLTGRRSRLWPWGLAWMAFLRAAVEEGKRVSSMAVSSQPGSASGLGQGSTGRWRVAGRGFIKRRAGCLSLSLCLGLVVVRFACLPGPFWGQAFNIEHLYSDLRWVPLCLWKCSCALNTKGTEAGKAPRHF